MNKVSHDQNSLRQRNDQWLRTHKAGPASQGQPILIAEDSEADVFFLLRVMNQAGVRNPICLVRSGPETLAFLQGTGPYADRAKYPPPGIVFLDLKMPQIDGFEILRWRKTQPHLEHTLMVAVSSYDGIYEINLAYESGADTFLSKPLAAEDVLNLINGFQDYWDLTHSQAKKIA